MKVIYKDSKEIKEIKYPAVDISTKIDLDEGISLYFIVEDTKPDYNQNFEYLKKADDQLIDEPHQEYKHLFVCKRSWIKVRYTDEQIIQTLNENLGFYLDEQYPIATREKHNFELQSVAISDERMDYLLSLRAWLENNRKLRDKYESDFIENGTLPDLNNWIVKP